MRSSASAIRWAVAASSSLELVTEPVALGRRDLAQLGGRGLARLVTGSQDHLAGRSEGDGLLGGRGAELGEPGLDGLGRFGDGIGRLGPLALEVGLGARQGLVQLVLLLVEGGSQLVLALGQGLAALAAATFGLLVELAQRTGAGLLVDMADDV
jgi:hypothetical protein